MKAHGAGNDFVLLPDLANEIELTAQLVRALCRPHVGMGADGVIRIGAGSDDADVFMDYWNADGSVSEMCGNGVRCVAKYVADRELVGGDVVRIDTRAGIKPVRVFRDPDGLVERVRVDMGSPVVGKVDWPLDVGDETVQVTTLSMGNPHAVVAVDDVHAVDLPRLGAAIGGHPDFPDGTNVEVINVFSRDRVVGRIFERGVGETLASGTGAAAMAAAAHLLGLAGRQSTVVLPGGELEIDWSETTLEVTGPAVEVGEGVLDDAWLTRIH